MWRLLKEYRIEAAWLLLLLMLTLLAPRNTFALAAEWGRFAMEYSGCDPDDFTWDCVVS